MATSGATPTFDARNTPTGIARAVAIGNFDGVHRGHARLVGDALAAARREGLEACALTFSPHPALVLAPDRAPPLIMSEARRIELLYGLGLDRVIVQPFDLQLAALSPRAFAETLLVGALGARVVCVGYDFSFGARRAGTTATLGELGAAIGFRAAITPAVRVRGVICASSTIRTLLGAGQVEEATALLGRAPELEGTVVRGAGRGRTIGVPTANLSLRTEVRPALGVYAGWAQLPDGGRRRAAINIGTNPTFTGTTAPVSVEAHLLDHEGDLYGASLRLELLTRLRAEQKFDGKDALVAQIRADIEAARVAEIMPMPPTD
jgi:riboflavin kinase/FMN adenylyltransferase